MQPNIMKSAMQNGLFLGALFSANFLFSASNVPLLMFLTYGITILILTTTYKISVKLRDNEFEGSISYGRAFLFIVYLFFYASLISTVVKYIYCRFMFPDYLETVYQATLKTMETLKFPINEAELSQQAENLLNPLNYSLATVWFNIFLGTIVALVMAAFIKKEKVIPGK